MVWVGKDIRCNFVGIKSKRKGNEKGESKNRKKRIEETKNDLKDKNKKK